MRVPNCFGCARLEVKFAPCTSHRMRQAAAAVMAEFPTAKSVGNWHVEPFELTKKEVDWARLRGAISGGGGGYAEVYDLEPGHYVRLVRSTSGTRATSTTGTRSDWTDTIVMSTTPMELRTNRVAVERAHGKVLIGGLGLGVVARAVASLRQVESVTVIERAQEVIDLVGPSLPLNIEIVPGDVATWTPPAGTRYDFVYLDIWDDIPNGDDWEEIKRLRRRFRRWSPGKDSVLCWREDAARRDARGSR